MDLDEAVAQINDIQKHLLKSETFRGYKPLPCLYSAGFAVILGIIQILFFKERSVQQLLLQWFVLAAVLFVSVFIWISIPILKFKNQQELKLLKQIMIQFLPFILSGAVFGLIFLYSIYNLIVPFLWTLVFGLGILSMSPYLPEKTRYIGYYYLLLSVAGCLFSLFGTIPVPVFMTFSFSSGHLFAAAILQLKGSVEK